jgi:SAM-dependent methyltransferase
MSTAGDLTVVIPTIGRWDVLRRTLDALAHQTAQGHEVVVVVDGADLAAPPDLRAERVLRVPHGGPGAARNAGVAAGRRPLVLFLGDDMIPTPGLVAHHVAEHDRHPEDHVAVLGLVEWHPEVADDPLAEWLEWSGAQFDYLNLGREPTDDAGFGRFYSCNVSLKRALLERARGFDESFGYFYEDLDAGRRFAQAGMVLRYQPAALAQHHHRYDWDGVVARFRGIAAGEMRMAERHEWFEPFFRARVEAAAAQRPSNGAWVRLARRLPPGPLRDVARGEANAWYLQRLAEPFLDAWWAEQDLAELQRYLGDDFDAAKLASHGALVEAEERAATDERAFYRSSQAYLYDLTAFAMSGTKRPYLRDLRTLVPPGASILDHGCGIGADGLRLAELGYRVAFADFDNPSTAYLRWRLAQRGIDTEVYDVEGHVPGGFDAVVSFDVIEHVADPVEYLRELESRGGLVVLNLLEPRPGDTHLHHELPVARLLERARRRGLVHHRRYHGRSHLVAYRGDGGSRVSAVRSRLEHVAGAGLGDRAPLGAGRRRRLGQLRRAAAVIAGRR